MNLSRIRLVTFDVTDTLLKFRTSPGKQYGEIGAMYGILCDNKALSNNFKAHWYKMVKEHPNFGLNTGLGWENWWKMIIMGTFRDAKFNVGDDKLEAVASHLIDIYKTSTAWQPCHGTMDLLPYLKEKGVTMGVISNFDPRIHVTLENIKLRHYFKFVLSSYEVGYEKPHPRIFTRAMNESGLDNLKSEECLHVGDTAPTDYLGAKSSGWQSALIHDKDAQLVRERHSFVHPNHIFSSLYDLYKLFSQESNNFDVQRNSC